MLHSPRAAHRRTVSSPVEHRERSGRLKRFNSHSHIKLQSKFATRHPRSVLLPMASSSSSDLEDSTQRPRPARTASRIMISVRRSLTPSSTPKKKHSDGSSPGMHPTSTERGPYSPTRFREPDPATSRPTVEQIAMGLHLSRTPHLRPLNSSRYPYSTPHSIANPHRISNSPIVLPPPPSRSSMKKPSTLASSSSSPAVSPPFSATSSTTVATSVASESSRPFSAIKYRMSRFLPGSRSSSAPSLSPSSLSSPHESTVHVPLPKKAVRFSANDEED